MAKQKPKGFEAFDALARKLIEVPKEKIAARIAADRAARRKAKRRK